MNKNTNLKTKNQIDMDLLLTRADLVSLLHCGLSTLNGSEIYASIPRIKIGRHTFFLKTDVMDFILSHRIGGEK